MNKEVKKIVNQIVKGYNPEKIILFGSHANDTSGKFSDVDLAIIKNTNKQTFFSRLKEVCSVIHSPLDTDLLVYTPKEWKFYADHYFIKEIINTGKIVYEK